MIQSYIPLRVGEAAKQNAKKLLYSRDFRKYFVWENRVPCTVHRVPNKILTHHIDII